MRVKLRCRSAEEVNARRWPCAALVRHMTRPTTYVNASGSGIRGNCFKVCLVSWRARARALESLLELQALDNRDSLHCASMVIAKHGCFV